MKLSFMSRCLLVIVALVSLQAIASAATLQAKVTEVESGNVLVVTNINRALRVRMKAIAPPEAGQPFSDAAREHLNALVLNKAVTVEYTHLASGYLEARVMLNGIDIGSQMIRDGVAWYDRTVEYSLSPSDRDLYARCEQAARDEKRGLWSDSKAIAPWEFRKSKAVAAAAEAAAGADAPKSFSALWAFRKSGASKVLSDKYFGSGMVEPGTIAGTPIIREIRPDTNTEEWTPFRSETPRFSILVPGNSYLLEFPVLDGDLKIVTIHYVVGINDGNVYALLWTEGSNDDSTDADTADAVMTALVTGINRYFSINGKLLTASFRSGGQLRVGSYSGKQYPVTAGDLNGFARVFSKQMGDQRRIFALAVFASAGDDSFNFLSSLKLAEGL